MWDPAKYLDYGDLRARPFHDLVGRIGAESPERVVDLGCGPGNLTLTLRKRWPNATVEALDSSPDMVAAAREAGVDARVADVRDWEPGPDTDVVVSNAVLQWVPGHAGLLRRWAERLRPGAWLAVQVPGNFDAPSHVLTRTLAESPEWAPRLADVVLREDDAVHAPLEYATLLADAGCAVDVWETTYLQRLTGENAVLEWITGTALRPVKAALDEQAWQRFRTQLAPLLDEAYPPRDDGTTWFPFRRVFAVARAG
ncbi:trans-aconitate 2-methyltransferase [Prauserella muralis]|uniref:Trans-aconitate 2-methyltransferase n=1 Tax=Prauserella muralis TaxID=588067 RepID=A0A2V4B0L2_9PSEU|nr:trans-aconitate 2-methyltransferase [Prauserella muralis]PXY27662.1 trans-aconitate methyltransferase [Prauserella muralis]TWE22602.1 trans-aconitate 2-methyltransferase [Prauserella muralis]